MSLKRHFTRHTTSGQGDSLDLFRRECELLGSAFREWEETRNGAQAGRMAGPANFDNGTIGKVILEHAAVQLWAARDLCRALRSHNRTQELEQIEHAIENTWPVIDRLDELGRGTEPVATAANEDFAQALSKLRVALEPMTDDGGLADRVERALGDRRHRLRTARYIRRHSPTHPGPGRWYDSVGPLLRLRTAYDRSRGFPWAESAPMASPGLAEGYAREAAAPGQ